MNNPKISYWKVNIIKYTFNSDGTHEIKEIESNKLPEGTNYLFIPVEYRKQSFSVNYRVNVSGLDAGSNEIVSENNIHLNDNNAGSDLIDESGLASYIETDCRETCIGSDYAYHIQQYLKQNENLSRFRLVRAYQAFDQNSLTANPYYYYSYTDFGNPTGDPTYRIGQFVSGYPGYVSVCDQAENPLVGLVWGYRKDMGIWEGNKAIETSGEMTNGTEFCSQNNTVNLAIDMMNGYADFTQAGGLPTRDPLTCTPAAACGSGGGGIDIGDPTPPEFEGFVTFCWDYLHAYNLIIGEPQGPCMNSIVNLLNPEIVSQIIITDMNDNTKPPTTINISELYNTNNGNGSVSNGEFNGFNVTLTPSLYSFGFMFVEKGYWAKIGEVTTKTAFSVSQADMIDINVFPTPMTGDNYSIEMKAHATLKFDYELRDFTGALVTTKNFTIHKDHEKIQQMNEKNIPEGFLVHRFIFEDGSVKTVQTIKN